jgi:protein-disulfide isomerase
MSSQNDPRASADGVSRKERRAAERSARKGGAPVVTRAGSSGRSWWITTTAAVVVGLVVVLGLVALSGGLGGEDVAAVSKPDEPAPAAALRVGRSLGDPEAPVKIEAFEDPQCPACGLFNERIEPLLIAGPVTDGRVFFTYKDFPFLGPESFDAAVAMRAAEELDGKFWDYKQLIFHNQEGENRGAFTLDRLADMAELVGLERQAFLAEVENPAHRAAVEAEAAEGAGLGVNSTPSLLINGQLVRGVPTWEDLSDQIRTAAEAAVAGGSPAPASPAP